jgi:signal transduction histidine kinase
VKAAFVAIAVGAMLLLVTLLLSQQTTGAAEKASATALLERFERTSSPRATVHLAERYAGRLELLDPRRALPTWHRHSRADAVRVHDASRRCGDGRRPETSDVELEKAFDFYDAGCRNQELGIFAERAPFIHPSGKSYASLVRNMDRVWLRAHLRSFHVLELGALDPALLDDEDRALASLEPSAWRAIEAGDRLVLAAKWLVVVERGPFGPARLRFHRRSDWDRFSAGGPLVLAPRGSSWCAEEASSTLCWRSLPVAPRDRLVFRVTASIGALLIVLGAAVLAIALVRARRAAEAERVFLLRALTHELRTPATTLKLDVEPLRSSFDELPADCQEPMLRVLDGVDRLARVLDVTGRALALLDEKAKSTTLEPRSVPSFRAWLEEIAAGWPDGVTLTIEGDDAALTIDPDWLAVAVRNLVENAVRHGKPPVRVVAKVENTMLSLRVTDGGETPDFLLKDAVVPFKRGQKSSGLGLGLALAHRIASLSKGRLVHEPRPTTFELRIPIALARTSA